MTIPAYAEMDPKELAHVFLKLIAEQYEQSRRDRLAYARWAREVGLTYREIAEDYGVSEDAIRKMLKRAN
jgi:predicted transcriptional regulator